MRSIYLAAGFCLCATAAAAAGPTQFWNQSKQTVASLRLSHAGSGIYGDNLALGREATPDQRLDIADLPSGFYDLEVKYKGGQTCFAHHIEVTEHKTFSVPDKGLIRCAKR